MGVVFEPDLHRAAHDLAAKLPALAAQDVLVCVPDRTRDFAPDATLGPLLSSLLDHGATPERVTVAIASGSHVASERDVARLGVLPHGVRVLRHDPDGALARVGTTASGTPLSVHPALLEADIVCAIGPIAFHYFAGYGGGGKLLFPGLGARVSIAANHRLALAPSRGLASGVEPGRLVDNPVAQDLRAAHRLLPSAHHLTTGDHAGAPFAARWNDYDDFDALALEWSSGRRQGIRHGVGFVMASAGAQGIDVVQAHKALFHAALFLRDGGELVLLAPCDEGIGSPALARWLAKPDRARLEADARAAYDLNAQTAISLAAIAERVRVTWLTEHAFPELARWGIDVTNNLDAFNARLVNERDDRLALHQPTRVLPADPRLVSGGEPH